MWGKADFKRQILEKKDIPNTKPVSSSFLKDPEQSFYPTPNNPIYPPSEKPYNNQLSTSNSNPNFAPLGSNQSKGYRYNCYKGGLSNRETDSFVPSRPNRLFNPPGASEKNVTKGGYLALSQYSTTVVSTGGLSNTTCVKPKAKIHEAFVLEIVVCFIARSRSYSQTVKSGELNERIQQIVDFIDVFFHY